MVQNDDGNKMLLCPRTSRIISRRRTCRLSIECLMIVPIVKRARDIYSTERYWRKIRTRRILSQSRSPDKSIRERRGGRFRASLSIIIRIRAIKGSRRLFPICCLVSHTIGSSITLHESCPTLPPESFHKLHLILVGLSPRTTSKEMQSSKSKETSPIHNFTSQRKSAPSSMSLGRPKVCR